MVTLGLFLAGAGSAWTAGALSGTRLAGADFLGVSEEAEPDAEEDEDDDDDEASR